MKIDGLNIWGKIVPSLAGFVFMGCNSLEVAWFFQKCSHFAGFKEDLILSVVLVSNIYIGDLYS